MMPPSRESEHKAITDTINQVCTKIKRFVKMYLNQPQIDYATCSSYLADLARSWSIELGNIKNSKDFVGKCKENNVNKGSRQFQTFQDLLTICDRAKDFESTIHQVWEKLVDCARNHVYKYCQSLAEYSESIEIKPVVEYDYFIERNKNVIDAKIREMNSKILQYGELKLSFHTFVVSGNKHMSVMEDMCILIVEISQALKEWVNEDIAYPERLWQEIVFNGSYKDKIHDDIDKFYFERASHLKRIERRKVANKKLIREHTKYKRERDRLKQSVEVISNRLSRLHEQIDETEQELQSVNASLNNRLPITPRQREDSIIQQDQLKQNGNKLHEQVEVMTKQHGRVQKYLKQMSDRTYEIKVEVITNRHEAEELEKQVADMDLDIREQQEQTHSIGKKSVVARKIRDMKLSPDTLRKIHQEKLARKPKGDY